MIVPDKFEKIQEPSRSIHSVHDVKMHLGECPDPALLVLDMVLDALVDSLVSAFGRPLINMLQLWTDFQGFFTQFNIHILSDRN